jgi:LmbE family N-acetylglucosaminyl deacetylase
MEKNNNLFLAPHCDDESLFGAYILMKYKPLVAIIHKIKCFPNVETRESESIEAMKYLSINVIFINNLSELSDDFNIVFVPALEHGHIDHDNMHLEANKKFKNIIYYSTYHALPDIQPRGNFKVEANDEMKRKKVEVLKFYKSQYPLSHFKLENKDEYVDKDLSIIESLING